MQRTVLLGLSVVLAVALLGCGQETDSGQTRAAEEGAKPTGAASPAALLDHIEGMVKTEAFFPVEIVDLVVPEERPAFAYVLTVLPVVLGPFIAAFGDEDSKAEVEKTGAAITALLEKHGVEGVAARLEKMKEDAGLTPEQKLAEFNEAMAGVDPKALLREAWPLLESLGSGGETTSAYDEAGFARSRASLDIQGDRATLDDPTGEQKRMVFVRAADGLWYLSALHSGLFDGP